jgi:phenylacetate-CoA ligase
MLPIITKDDLRRNAPDRIIPPGFRKDRAHLFTTSGSTGEPVTIYKDYLTVVRGQIIGMRMYKANGINWRKHRIAHIGDFGIPGSYDEECLKGFSYRNLKTFFDFSNVRLISFKTQGKDIMQELDAFQPDVIYTDPHVLRELATMKAAGLGEHISPQWFISNGATLNPHLRTYVEEVFGGRIIDNFGSSEGGAIAFQCPEGNYHFNSDIVHIEVIDEEGCPVGMNMEGRLALTRLYGKGTPIIRYTGMNDILVLTERHCTCGLNLPLIEKIIGRRLSPIVLANGRNVSGFSFIQIPYEVMKSLRTDKIKQFQILQKKPGEIEVLIVVDESLRDIGPPLGILFQELQKAFHREAAGDLKISVRETKEIPKRRAREYPPLIKSLISDNDET